MKPKVKSTEHAIPDPVSASVLFFTEMAVQGVEKFVDAQKSLWELTVEQSTAVANASKDFADAASKFAATLAGVAQQSAERAAAAGKSTLEFAATQNARTIERLSKPFAPSETVSAVD